MSYVSDLHSMPQANDVARDARRRYALWILMLGCALNFLDRNIINMLAEPIRREFGLSDAQLGLLTGLTFAAFHAALTLPLARLADRVNRIRVIACSMLVWSLATVACGFAGNFLQLLAARMAVGAGEAGGVAPAHALIADITPRQMRARSIAFFSVGIPLGGLLGMALGGLLLDAYGWRVAFVFAGVPGLALALLMVLSLRDPKRTADAQIAEPPLSVAEVAREITSKKAFVLVAAAGASAAFASFGQAAFIASFFFRVHGPGLQQLASNANVLLGTTFGAAALVGVALALSRGATGIAGVLIGGRITDRMNGGGYLAYATVPALMSVLRAPLFIAALLCEGPVMAFVLVAAQSLLGGIGLIGGFGAVQGLVRPRARATAAAIYGIGINLIGLGLGPLCIGLISDAFAAGGLGSAEGLRWALVASTVPMLLAAWLNLRARHLLARESIS